METRKLNNGVEIPVVGLGTYKIGNTDKETYRAVRTAWMRDTGISTLPRCM